MRAQHAARAQEAGEVIAAEAAASVADSAAEVPAMSAAANLIPR